MTSAQLTRHAIERLAQRGMSASDVELIELIGSEVPDGYLVSAKDRQAVEHELRKLIQRIRRLEGKRVVVAEERIVTTAFHASRREERRLLRCAAERNLEVAA